MHERPLSEIEGIDLEQDNLLIEHFGGARDDKGVNRREQPGARPRLGPSAEAQEARARLLEQWAERERGD